MARRSPAPKPGLGTQVRDLLRFRSRWISENADVAAEQRAALARQAFAEAGRDRADAGDRHHAERDAGDENVEAAQAAAHSRSA